MPVLFSLLFLVNEGRTLDQNNTKNQAIIGLLAKRHLKSILLAGR